MKSLYTAAPSLEGESPGRANHGMEVVQASLAPGQRDHYLTQESKRRVSFVSSGVETGQPFRGKSAAITSTKGETLGMRPEVRRKKRVTLP